MFSPRAPWLPPLPKVKLPELALYPPSASANIQLAQRAGRHTKKSASEASLYGAFGSAPGLGVTPEGVRKAKAPPPDGCSEHQYETGGS